MALALLFVASPVYAADPMTVIFESNPLFGEVNFLPGDSKDGDATVTNNTPDVQSVYAESVNGFDPDGLGSQLYLKVFENLNPIPVYQDEFDDFLSAGPVPLSSLGALATKTYTFAVSFIDSADNDYMGKSLGFDLCIGFSGGTFQCGDTVIGDEEPIDEGSPSTGSGSSSGGGGGSGQFLQLVIFNELVSNIVPGDQNVANGTATIEWDTNLLATSQVIYGSVPPGGYILNTAILPNLGYPLGTVENGTKVLHHSVVLTGLVGGQTYVYRVVSRASPPTVSVEHTFTMPTAGTTGNFGIAQANEISRATLDTNATSGTSGAGSEDGTEEDSLTATSSDSLISQLAAAFLGFDFPGLLCIGVALIIFLVILGLIWLISRHKKEKSLAKDTILSVIFGLIASFILWLIPYTCSIVPLWIIIAIYIIWRLISNRYFTNNTRTNNTR